MGRLQKKYAYITVTLQLGSDLHRSAYCFQMIPSIVIVRQRRKQLFILLVNTGIRYLGEVLRCQISLGNVVGGGGSMNTFPMLPAALPVLIIRGCTGLTAQGGLYVCEDY